ncbi:uncharacterized protein LOC118204944 isoform X1 [Stegodyphus dumicola]|uniref:uncharacterized protein LOC118204944 isoform X1 n=1 Tax=Stegodyphus dumicola TaxID=202533 RepID=UPI0015AB43F9|nr:uncharacterized protein LOC118204944 isoform X1 [Stegodyphus dumicola]
MQYKSAWQFYTSLQFLSDAVSLRNTVTSLDFNDTSTQERSAEVTRHSEMFDINDFEDTEETQREEESQKELCHSQTQLKRHTSNTTTSNKKQKHDHIYTAATTTLEEISTILKSKNTTPNTFTQFGSFVGSELSLIRDPQLLTDTKYKIYQILTDAQTEQNVLDSMNNTE